MLPHARWWLPGAYLLIVVLAGMNALLCAGDMCTLYLGIALMPWIMIPPLVPFPVFDAVPLLPWLFTGLGFIVNLGLLGFIGGLLDAWRARSAR
jgi:hypothetical protein